ncbi:MAG: hypothetical protein C0501_13140 [Isosphaera sp.]|nr:hypothetical protein [Isosphaera sp.]
MRVVPLSAAFAALVVSLAPAADPPPLLRAVAPPAGAARVRIPLKEDKATVMQFRALVPKPKGQKGEPAEIKVTLGTIDSHPLVYTKTWEKWGFAVPENRTGVIPELVVPAGVLSPRPAKGRDAEVRFTDVKVEVRDGPGGAETFGGCDLLLRVKDLTRDAERAVEPQLFFADRFLDLTLPSAAVRRLNTGPEALPELAVTATPGLVPAAGPMVDRGWPTFAFAAVNGQAEYKDPAGKTHPVRVGVHARWTGVPVVVTAHTATGCGVEFTPPPAGDWSGVKGRAKELRLGLVTGPGLKAAKDLVLKDLDVWVTRDESHGFVSLTPRFVEEYFADGAYACGPDGAWRLHGRVKPELLQDVKTRPPAPKKP